MTKSSSVASTARTLHRATSGSTDLRAQTLAPPASRHAGGRRRGRRKRSWDL